MKLRRRNFKSIRRDALEEALNIHDWAWIYSLKDVDEVHRYIVRGIVKALDVVASIKEIVVKTGSNLYITKETLKMIKRRDTAKFGTPRFCALRSAANRLVKRDKLTTNAETLAKSSNNPCVLWQLANSALGKAPPSLPPALVNATGGKTSGKREAAKAMNTYFISKVDTLRAAALADPASESVDLTMDIKIPMVETVNLASDAASLTREVANTAGDESTQATDVPVLARDSANELTLPL
jgi:hypothetical protein